MVKGNFASISFHPGKIDVELVYIIAMDEYTADVVVLSTNDSYIVGKKIKVLPENIVPTFPHSDKILKIIDFVCNYVCKGDNFNVYRSQKSWL